MQNRLRPVALLVFIVAGSLLGSCSSPSEPTTREATWRIGTINEPVDGTVAAGDSVRISIVVPADEYYTLTLNVLSGSASVVQRDSATQSVQMRLQAAATSGANTVDTVEYTPTRASLQLIVTGAGSFRVSVKIPLGSAEDINSSFAINDTVAGERIDFAGDRDVFSFKARAGDELIAYVQATDPAATTTGAVVLRIWPGHDPFEAGVYAGAGVSATRQNADLESGFTQRFTIPADGRVLVGIEGESGYQGSYRFMVRRVTRGPEHAPTALALNDSASHESLDYSGDVDEFTFRGTPGAHYSLLFQAAPQQVTDRVLLFALTNSIDPGILAESKAADSALTREEPVHLTIPDSGVLALRVQSRGTYSDGTGPAKGPYRMFVYQVNGAPEHRAASVALGDTIADERFDLPDDSDEYQLTVPRDTVIVLGLDAAADSVSYVRATIFGADDSILATIGSDHFPAPDGHHLSESVPIRAGTYRMVATSTRVLGSYRLWTYGVSDAPEGRSANIAIEDTVYESIDPPGDRDVYRFAGTAGDVLQLMVSADGTAQQTVIGDVTLDANGTTTTVASAWAEPTSRVAHSQRFVLSATGEYTVHVQGPNIDYPERTGAYHFAVHRLTTTPETHAAVVALGDTISDESIDFPDDLDDFEIHGAPGAEFVALISPVPSPGIYLALDVIDPATHSTLTTIDASGWPQTTAHVYLPASGVLVARVRPGGQTGPYRLELRPVNRAPEHAPATLSVGDSVSEALDVDSDIDIFHFTADSAQKVELRFQFPRGPVTGSPRVLVIDDATQAVLASQTVGGPDVYTTGTLILPRAGSYTIYVGSEAGDKYGTGPYWLALKPGQ